MVSILASIKIPTLVMGGEASPVWMHHAVEVTANHIHGAQSQILEGQKHDADPNLIAPVSSRFFNEE